MTRSVESCSLSRSLTCLHLTTSFPEHWWPYWDPVLSNSFSSVSHKLLSSTRFPPAFMTSQGGSGWQCPTLQRCQEPASTFDCCLHHSHEQTDVLAPFFLSGCMVLLSCKRVHPLSFHFTKKRGCLC